MQQAEAIEGNESSEEEEDDVLDQKQEFRQPQGSRDILKATTQASPNSSHVENLRDSMDCDDEL